MATEVERARITRQLGWDGRSQPTGAEQWIAWSHALAHETAMRRGEILRLTWRHVHLTRALVHLPRTKNGYARDVPLSSAARALFGLIAVGEPDAVVVPVAGPSFDTMWRRAMKAAHIEGLHFHDSRRSGTTAMAAKLGDVLELAAVTGHRSLNILRQTYYQPDATAIARKLG